MMNQLPYIDLSWVASLEPAVTFIAYTVYRRKLGDKLWTRLVRLSDRNNPHYNDYNAQSGITYEYTVTVAKSSDNGEEIESAQAAPMTAILWCRSIFIHDVYAPNYYVELKPISSSVNTVQVQAYLQPRNTQSPVMHIGQVESRTLAMQTTREWATDNDRYAALAVLFTRQRTAGSTLLARGWRFGGMFCQMADLPRNDLPVVFDIQVTLMEVTHTEAV